MGDDIVSKKIGIDLQVYASRIFENCREVGKQCLGKIVRGMETLMC